MNSKDLLEKWKKSMVVKERSQNTIREYINDVTLFFNWIKQEKNIQEVTIEIIKSISPEDLDNFMYYLKVGKNNSVSTRVRRGNAIRTFYCYLQKTLRLITHDENVARDMELPSIPHRTMGFLTAEESKEFMREILKGSHKIRNKAIFAMYLSMGLRLSELINLNLDDIKDGQIKFIGKGNKEAIIPIPPKTMEAINEWLEIRPKYLKGNDNEPALFISERDGRRLKQGGIQKKVKSVMNKIGRPDCSTHALRHSAISMMLKNGTDLKTIQEIARHASFETTKDYIHVLNEQKKAAVNSIDILD